MIIILLEEYFFEKRWLCTNKLLDKNKYMKP